ncbi:MAG: ligase-associated DNA damage response endonuclease PdeM [Planctomycetia bacterium]
MRLPPRIAHVGGDGAAPADHDILLVAGRAAVLPASRTLLVADLHLGKAATFRRAGIPVPEGSAQQDLARLERLVADSHARRVLVLGDLFHAARGCTAAVFAEFAAFRRRIADTRVVLVVGNHDRSVGKLPDSLGLDDCVPTLDEPPYRFVHEPVGPLGDGGHDRFTIAGHLHPTVRIASPSGDRFVDRCFVAGGDTMILPAFGSFTGGQRIEPDAGMRLWIARDDGVVEGTALARR